MKIIRSKKYDSSIKVSELEPGEVFMFFYCNDNDQLYMRMSDIALDGAINTVNLETGASAMINQNSLVKKVECKLIVSDKN